MFYQIYHPVRPPVPPPSWPSSSESLRSHTRSWLALAWSMVLAGRTTGIVRSMVVEGVGAAGHEVWHKVWEVEFGATGIDERRAGGSSLRKVTSWLLEVQDTCFFTVASSSSWLISTQYKLF